MYRVQQCELLLERASQRRSGGSLAPFVIATLTLADKRSRYPPLRPCHSAGAAYQFIQYSLNALDMAVSLPVVDLHTQIYLLIMTMTYSGEIPAGGSRLCH